MCQVLHVLPFRFATLPVTTQIMIHWRSVLYAFSVLFMGGGNNCRKEYKNVSRKDNIYNYPPSKSSALKHIKQYICLVGPCAYPSPAAAALISWMRKIRKENPPTFILEQVWPSVIRRILILGICCSQDFHVGQWLFAGFCE